MDHHWVATSWLSDVGLPQYSQAFQAHLVDGRVLNSLSHRDLKQFFNISDQNHQTSLLLAIQLLQIVSFDKEVRAYAKSPKRPLVSHSGRTPCDVCYDGGWAGAPHRCIISAGPLPSPDLLVCHLKAALVISFFCVFTGSAGTAGKVRAPGLGPHCLDKSQSNQVD